MLIGQDASSGTNLFRLSVVTPDGTPTEYDIDATTFYLAQTITTVNVGGNPVVATTYFSDYRKTASGLVVAYAETLEAGASSSTRWDTVDINKVFDPHLFDMPSQ